ncbi:MAG: S41 family peptidase, partial [Myxococcota bacterium]
MIVLALACAPPLAPPSPSAVLLDAERRLLQVAEREVLWKTAATAPPAEAAAAAVLGLELDPARFGPVVDRLSTVDDVDVLELLASRVDRERYGARAEQLRVRERYRSGAGEFRWVGVDRPKGERVLVGIDAEYVSEVPHDRMVAAAVRRFEAMWAVREHWARWARPVTAGATVLATIDDAIAAGLPEPEAVGEGVEAALAALDPYTVPVWPAEIARWREHHAGSSTGIGVELAAEGPRVVVSLPVVDGPAWVAGVHAGDVLLAIDGGPVDSVGAANAALGGEPGTTVELTVGRDGAERTYAIVRAAVPEETVKGYRRTADGWDPWVAPGIALVHVSAFRPHTDRAFDAVVPASAEAVVLDLRGNSGGDVMAAVEIADRFVADGELAWLGGRTVAPPAPGANGELPWNAAVPGQAFEGVPVVVLVDRRTASSAELVAGALRERAGAVLVGDRTYGKGLAQALRTDDALGVAWQVTNGTWMTPSRRALEGPGGARSGLEPDLALALSPSERLLTDAMRRRRELPPTHPD